MAWVVTLGACILLLDAAGGSLATPPLFEMQAWRAWSVGRDPVEAVFAIARLAATMVAWYLLAATALAVVARATRLRGLIAFADVVTVPFVRRIVHGALGMGLAAATVTSAAGPALPPVPVPVAAAAEAWSPGAQGPAVEPAADGRRAIMRHLDEDDASLPGSGVAPARLPVLAPLPFDDPGALPRAPRSAAEPMREPMREPVPQPVHEPARKPSGATVADERQRQDAVSRQQVDGVGTSEMRWEARCGDHLWAIAQHVLERTRDGAPSEREIERYWRRLIEANRDRLPDPRNPDLIFPGQVFELPPVT